MCFIRVLTHLTSRIYKENNSSCRVKARVRKVGQRRFQAQFAWSKSITARTPGDLLKGTLVAFKKPPAVVSIPESPDRLFRDLSRRKHASLYDHQGQMLRTYSAKALLASDVALQLPTGSGKTLVGLLLAEWRRRKYRERVVYLCPTRQLVNQVAEEASAKYGLTVESFTGAKANYSPDAKTAYLDCERVAVTTYSSLFNTNPFFADPQVIIVDDAHAAENYIASQWTLRINRNSDEQKTLFNATSSVLKGGLSDASYLRLVGGVQTIEDVSWVDKLPSHKLVQLADDLRSVISANVVDNESKYSWKMIGNHLEACQLYVSSSEIMIRPLIPPTWSHRPFANAKQRIFMSATLGAGGDLERLTGRKSILRLPVPDGWDRQGIGRRFFIFPEKSLNEQDSLGLRRKLMQKAGRSLVLTTNDEVAKEIGQDVEDRLGYSVFTGSDLETQKHDFVTSTKAVAVVANRYDGIDLPDDDCRMLFVEGLPRAATLQERFLMSRMGANLLFNERVQTRVLQAVGRCTRGLNDFSVVVVTGQDLPAYLTDLDRRSFLHPELQAELAFGIEQSGKVDEATLLENVGIFLEHGEEWEAANQNILETRATAVQKEFPAMQQLDAAVAHEIKWQMAMWDQDYAKAFEAAREVLGTLDDPSLRGYRALWHYLAGSAAELAANQGDVTLKAASQQQYKKAKDAATGIPWLISLARGTVGAVTPEESQRRAIEDQVEQLESYIHKLGTVHNRKFTDQEKKIRDGLASGDGFEQAQVLLGEHLGFSAGKQESDASPDPWWIVGDIVLVFEDHANARPETAVIDATKARQAGSHPNWLREKVPLSANATIYPILVTPAKSATSGALPHLNTVWYWGLDEFREWAESALVTVRELRSKFVHPGDLAWRADAAQTLVGMRADAPGLAAWLSTRPAREFLGADS